MIFQTASVDKLIFCACYMVHDDHIVPTIWLIILNHIEVFLYISKTALPNMSSCDVMCSVSVLLVTVNTVHFCSAKLIAG